MQKVIERLLKTISEEAKVKEISSPEPTEFFSTIFSLSSQLLNQMPLIVLYSY